MAARHIEIDTKTLTDRLDVGFYLTRVEVDSRIGSDFGRPLGELCDYVRTKTPAADLYGLSGVPCLKLRNVTDSFLNSSDCECIPPGAKSKFVLAQPKDIIVSATGEGTAGRADIFMEEGDFVVTGENILLRPRKAEINAFFLLAALRSGLVRRQLTSFVRGATGQTHLYWKDIAGVRIPVIPDPQQAEYEVAYLEALELYRLGRGRLQALEREADELYPH